MVALLSVWAAAKRTSFVNRIICGLQTHTYITLQIDTELASNTLNSSNIYIIYIYIYLYIYRSFGFK